MQNWNTLFKLCGWGWGGGGGDIQFNAKGIFVSYDTAMKLFKCIVRTESRMV